MHVDYVREAMQHDAELAGPPPADPYDTLLAMRRTSDRRRLSSLAAGLAVLMVAVLVPVGLSLLGDKGDQVAAPPPLEAGNIFDSPTRGSLADDADFLQALTELSWVPAEEPAPNGYEPPVFPNPPVNTRYVAFAGDVPGGRWALVVGPNDAQPTGDTGQPENQTDLAALSDTAGLWFVGPPGADPEQMRMANPPRGLLTDMPASLYDGTTGALVVLAAPGDAIEVSLRPDVASDATESRTYVSDGTDDGLTVSATDPNPYASFMPAVQYRVSRADELVVEQWPEGFLDANALAVPEIDLDYLRPPLGDLPANDLRRDEWRLAAGLLGQYGLPPDQLILQVHYSGPVTGGGTDSSIPTLAVLTATFPSGAVLTRAVWTQQLPTAEGPDETAIAGGECANDLSAAGEPATQRTIGLQCVIASTGGGGPPTEPFDTLVLLATIGSGASSAVVTGANGSITIPLTNDGSALVDFPEGAETVQIQAADGTVLDEVSILTF